MRHLYKTRLLDTMSCPTIMFIRINLLTLEMIHIKMSNCIFKDRNMLSSITLREGHIYCNWRLIPLCNLSLSLETWPRGLPQDHISCKMLDPRREQIMLTLIDRRSVSTTLLHQSLQTKNNFRSQFLIPKSTMINLMNTNTQIVNIIAIQRSQLISMRWMDLRPSNPSKSTQRK